MPFVEHVGIAGLVAPGRHDQLYVWSASERVSRLIDPATSTFAAMIQVQEMVQQMRQTLASGKPRPFGLLVCTADRQRQTGGRLLDLPKVVLITKKRQSERMLLVQPVGTRELVRLHLDLILFFNNLEVA